MNNILDIKIISTQEWAKTFLIAIPLFLLFGTTTALWDNSYFIRMTTSGIAEYAILALESLLLGLYLAIKTPKACASGKAMTGSVFGFLGFSCPVCIKFLVLIFGSTFLLSYFEPIRIYVGLFGVVILLIAVNQKIKQKSVIVPASIND